MRYAAHAHLANQARPSAQLWRLALGIGITLACYFALTYTYFNLLAELVTQDNWAALSAEIDAGSTPRGMMALLGVFGMLTLSLLLVTNQLHRRQLRSFLGPPGAALRDFLRVSVALAALGTLLWLLPEPAAMAPQPGLPFLRWLALLPLTLPLVFVQISAEELAFRGYLQGQLAGRFSTPLVWLAVPALVFGALHYDPVGAGANAPIYVVTATIFGLAAGDLTARTGTLGAALALHFALNISALLITAPMGQSFGLALNLFPFSPADISARATWLPYDTLVMLCAWLAARLAISR
ncbi:lysostaphin resistance A-like protein [Aquicoccus sp. G2-2]|uniref:CPBP family intramembrane glutamic endopeptidase n=1 Tax=Aquicoccus sp. G2-2 TaxID=3092120 RepID=UPI002ADF1123|nr:CPBP family intramembrane glutamic endopeptidase [Aquicoccus sp. G2-2]MEA1115210.1 CPBP family intramembrane glutamic endopeptidase [Aquicoccus sp. G2-2]